MTPYIESVKALFWTIGIGSLFVGALLAASWTLFGVFKQ